LSGARRQKQQTTPSRLVQNQKASRVQATEGRNQQTNVARVSDRTEHVQGHAMAPRFAHGRQRVLVGDISVGEPPAVLRSAILERPMKPSRDKRIHCLIEEHLGDGEGKRSRQKSMSNLIALGHRQRMKCLRPRAQRVTPLEKADLMTAASKILRGVLCFANDFAKRKIGKQTRTQARIPRNAARPAGELERLGSLSAGNASGRQIQDNEVRIQLEIG